MLFTLNTVQLTRITLTCPGVPDAPRSISVEASLPDAIELHVESPDEDGGMPVIGYRIQHDDVIEDFDDPGITFATVLVAVETDVK